MATTGAPTSKRTTYHHGDLHHALIEAGMRLAREGGPDAVVLREATRRVGVAANAAYRHFADRDALLQAVCSQAQSAVAVAMEAEIAAVGASGAAGADPQAGARARLRAVGAGYLRFAQAEPGLFLTAFSVPDDLRRTASPSSAGDSGLTPFQLLAAALDEMVTAGVLPPEQRPGAELLAWSAVHGLAMLVIGGPLRSIDPEELQRVSSRLLDMVDNGLPAAVP